LKNNHIAMLDSADVAGCLNRTENSILRFNQKAIYTIHRPRKHKTRRNSSAVGGIPITNIPNAMTIRPSVMNKTMFTSKAAVNFAFNTYIGRASCRERE